MPPICASSAIFQFSSGPSPPSSNWPLPWYHHVITMMAAMTMMITMITVTMKVIMRITPTMITLSSGESRPSSTRPLPCDQSNDYDDHHDITIVILMINMIVIMASTTMIYSLPTVKITLMTMTFVAHTSWHSFLLKHKTPVLGWWMEGSSSSASSFVKPNVAQEGSEFISVSIIFNCLLLLQRSRREN